MKAKVNFQNYYFKLKYNRDPKYWSIDKIHSLYQRALERSEKRNSEKLKCIDEIIENIPKNDRGEHVVYHYSDGDNNNIHKFTF